MNTKLSHKDWKLIAGILVAMIVALTIFVLKPDITSHAGSAPLIPGSTAGQ